MEPVSHFIGNFFGWNSQAPEETQVPDTPAATPQVLNQEQTNLPAPPSQLEVHNRARIDANNDVKAQLDTWLDRIQTPAGQFSYNETLSPYCSNLSYLENWTMLACAVKRLETKSDDIRLLWIIHANLEGLFEIKIIDQESGQLVEKIVFLYKSFIIQDLDPIFSKLFHFRNQMDANRSLTDSFVKFKEVRLPKWQGYMDHFIRHIQQSLPPDLFGGLPQNLTEGLPQNLPEGLSQNMMSSQGQFMGQMGVFLKPAWEQMQKQALPESVKIVSILRTLEDPNSLMLMFFGNDIFCKAVQSLSPEQIEELAGAFETFGQSKKAALDQLLERKQRISKGKLKEVLKDITEPVANIGKSSVERQLDSWLDREQTPNGKFSYNETLAPYCSKLSYLENWNMLVYAVELLETHSKDIRLSWVIHANLEALFEIKIPENKKLVEKIELLCSKKFTPSDVAVIAVPFAVIEKLYSFRERILKDDSLTENFVKFKEGRLTKWDDYLTHFLQLLPKAITSNQIFPDAVVKAGLPELFRFLFQKGSILNFNGFFITPVTDQICLFLPICDKNKRSKVVASDQIVCQDNEQLANELKSLPDVLGTAVKCIQVRLGGEILTLQSELMEGMVRDMMNPIVMMENTMILQSKLLFNPMQWSPLLELRSIATIFMKLNKDFWSVIGSFLDDNEEFCRAIDSLDAEDIQELAEALEAFCANKAKALRQMLPNSQPLLSLEPQSS